MKQDILSGTSDQMTRRIVCYQFARVLEELTVFIFVISPSNWGGKPIQNIATILKGCTAVHSRRLWWFRGFVMCSFVKTVPLSCCDWDLLLNFRKVFTQLEWLWTMNWHIARSPSYTVKEVLTKFPPPKKPSSVSVLCLQSLTRMPVCHFSFVSYV